MFKKILCPTDFSEASYAGLAKAIEIAELNGTGVGGTEVCVVHVEPEIASEPVGPASEEGAEANRRAATVWNLRVVVAERVPDHTRSRPLLKTGDAGTEVVRAASEEGADLIVLSTHGAHGWRLGELGAVAEHVLRSAPCPVLVVNGLAGGPAPEMDAMLQESQGAMRPALAVASPHAIFVDGD